MTAEQFVAANIEKRGCLAHLVDRSGGNDIRRLARQVLDECTNQLKLRVYLQAPFAFIRDDSWIDCDYAFLSFES